LGDFSPALRLRHLVAEVLAAQVRDRDTYIFLSAFPPYRVPRADIGLSCAVLGRESCGRSGYMSCTTDRFVDVILDCGGGARGEQARRAIGLGPVVGQLPLGGF